MTLDKQRFSFGLLRAAAVTRVLGALVAIGVLWIAVCWAVLLP